MTITAHPSPAKPRALPISVSARPDALWPEPESGEQRRRLHLLVLGVVAVTVPYLLWRMLATLTSESVGLGIALLVLEAWSLASLAVAAVALWDVDSVRRPDDVTETSALVAVVIPSFDEPLEVLMPTLAAATRMRLASQILVLDDGHREWLAGMCDELGVEYRTRVSRSGGTAGQLNAVLPTLSADFVVVLEADQVADRDFIGRTLAHFEDPTVALVQTAHDFYNTDSYEHVSRGRERRAEQNLAERVLAAGRNRSNSATWTGGGAIMRLDALEAIDGLVAGEALPGSATTLALHRSGWRTVHHNEVLARGRAACDAAEYADRRAGSAAANLLLLRRSRFVTGAGLTLAQRLSYLTALTSSLGAWRTFGYLLLAPAALLLALTPAAGPVGWFVLLFLAVFALRQVATRALGRGHSPSIEATVFDIVRMAATLGATRALVTGRLPRRRADRNARRVPAVLWAVAGVNALALLRAAVVVAGPMPAEYPVPLIAVVAALWTAGNVYVVLRAVSRIRSHAFGGDRRSAQRVEAEGHVYLDGRRAHVLDVSLTGVRLLAYGPVPELGTYVAMTFTDPNRRPAVVTGTVTDVLLRPHGHELRVGFEADQTYVLGAIMAEALISRT